MTAQLAVVGGTFDRLHAGHRELLHAAFDRAARVAIGLTTDGFLVRHPKPHGRRIASYATRRRRLAAYLRAHYPRSRWRIVPLEDGWGGSVEPGPDLLVASEDTRAGALSVNRERRRRGLAPLRLHLIPLRRGDDGLPISSRRIRAGLIEPRGGRLRPLRAAYTGPAVWRASVRDGIAIALPGVTLRWGPGDSVAELSVVVRPVPGGRTIAVERPPDPARRARLAASSSPVTVTRAVVRLVGAPPRRRRGGKPIPPS